MRRRAGRLERQGQVQPEERDGGLSKPAITVPATTSPATPHLHLVVQILCAFVDVPAGCNSFGINVSCHVQDLFIVGILQGCLSYPFFDPGAASPVLCNAPLDMFRPGIPILGC